MPCANILSLSKRGRREELEAACAKINELGGTATYTRVKNTMSALRSEDPARTGANGAAAPASAPGRDRAAHAGRVRGADYYRGGVYT